ncbi:MAG: C45 family autoproteolytic acyltransferase/hydrolase [Promethearchaeota archaeon]
MSPSNFEWKNSNEQPYLHIEADNHYDLGYATGQGLIKQLTFLKLIADKMSKGINTDLSMLGQLAKQFVPHIPKKYLDELHGITDGANAAGNLEFSFDEILTQALNLEIFHGQLPHIDIFDTNLMNGCTDFGAINPDGTVVMGQNYDSPKMMSPALAWVLHKVGDEPWVFTHRIGATPAVPMDINEHGVCITVNVVLTKSRASIMTPRFVLLREAMSQAKTAEEAYKILFREEKFPFGQNLLISDRKKIIAVQLLPNEIRPTYVKKTIVQSNQYDYVDWRDTLRKPDYSQERQQYSDDLLSRISREKVNMTNEDLLNILRDDPIICREDPTQSGYTVAFMTRESFGLGNAKGPVGNIPL